MNGVHDVLNFGPSTALHEAGTRPRVSASSRASTVLRAIVRSPAASLWGGGSGGAWVCPDLNGVEEGLLHPIFGAGELFSAHSDEPQGTGYRLFYHDFIGSQGFQRQGGNLHAGVHGHV